MDHAPHVRHRRARTLATVSAAAMALLACPGVASAQPHSGNQPPIGNQPPAGSVDLATSGNGVHYRIPSITVTPKGTVIAAYDRRNDGPEDLPGDVDTMVRRSTDGGATWSDPQAALDDPAPQGCGDPSLLTDRTNGRVHLFCTYSHGEVGFQDSEPGSADATDRNTVHVRKMTSDDEGRTWSEPTDLNAQIKDPAWAGVFASSGHGVQTAGGRLLQPVVVRDSSGTHHSANIYSDDHGKTWQHGELLAGGTDESEAVELSTGRVVQNSRDVDGGRRLRSVSEDGGVSFGEPEEVGGLPDPGVNADEIRVDPRKDDSRLLFSNSASRSGRENLTVRSSCDNGGSWSDGEVLYPHAAGYSAMTMLPNDRVGVFVEHGDNGASGKLTFTSLPLDEIEQC